MDPAEAHRKIDALFDGAMRGRTMYVIPYCMGPIDSPFARCGVEITDSPYVVVNMRIMTRMGDAALRRIEREGTFVKGLHSIGDLDPDRRFIMHFPEELTIKSVGSGYGGNALLGKKCHALRIASWQARDEGWLAEHMLIMGVQSPEGKHALHRRRLPVGLRQDQSRDAGAAGLDAGLEDLDRRRRHLLAAGRQRRPAARDQSGSRLLRRRARHEPQDQPQRLRHDPARHDLHQRRASPPTISRGGKAWTAARRSIDWQGKPYTPGNGPAAHPNSRFTVSAKQNPIYSTLAEAPEGVPISAILFGGRRREVAPLVYEARSWSHGVLVGAGMASETTAAAVGQMGVVRRDSMAMKPFCGYNFGDYWQHWLSFEGKAKQAAAHLPRQLVPPGQERHASCGRATARTCACCAGSPIAAKARSRAVETPIGYLPRKQDLDVSGLDIDSATLETLLSIDPVAWRQEIEVDRQVPG